MGFACDCVPSGQSENRKFLPPRNYIEAGLWKLWDFVPVISLKLLEGSQFPSRRQYFHSHA